MLTASGLTAAYSGQPVFEDLAFSVEPGDTLVVLGASGCGKTTLLMLLAGLKSPSTGSVSLDGAGIEPGSRRTGLILQNYGLFPWYSAEKNVDIGLAIRDVSKRRRREICRSALERVGLGEKARCFPRELSGGEQQRVALARTLALQPRLLLMDEPFSALDALSRERLQDLLLDLLAVDDFITVLVTHSIEEAVYLGTGVLVMGSRGARFTAIGPHGGRGSRGFFEQVLSLRRLLEELTDE